MTEFECGCRIISDVINLNKGSLKQPCWNCSKKQMKFQQSENIRIMEERERMVYIMNMKEMNQEEEEEFEEEYKEQFRNMTDEEVEKHIGLEKVRNVMEGYDREHGIAKIRRMIEEVRNEDKEEEYNESEDSEFQRNIWIYKNNSD